MAYNHKNTGRPLKEGKWFEKFRSNYLDVSNDPLYPFGYGLSYTTFQYSDITLSSKQLNADGKPTASVTVPIQATTMQMKSYSSISATWWAALPAP